jgi:hypothetical protein
MPAGTQTQPPMPDIPPMPDMPLMPDMPPIPDIPPIPSMLYAAVPLPANARPTTAEAAAVFNLFSVTLIPKSSSD